MEIEKENNMIGKRIKVLFLCTGNSCRSQMAEGWTRNLKGDIIDAQSAGVEPKQIDSRAIEVMAEAGVNISGRRSKSIEDLEGASFDYVITLCDHAKETCPFFPAGTRLIHKGFDDPPQLAAHAKNREDQLAPFRRVRDEIKAFVEKLPEALEDS